MSEYKRVFRFFTVGQEDVEAAWLSKMSKKGYHLEDVKFGMFYKLRKGEPKNYAYYIDMNEDDRLDEEYKQMYLEAGLDYIDKTNGYYYFRGDENINISELSKTDEGRYVGRLNVQKNLLYIVGIINLIIFIINSIQFRGVEHYYSWAPYINLICGLFCSGLALKLQFKIKDMKKCGVKEYYKTNMKDYKHLYSLASICISLIVVYSIVALLDLFLH